LKGVSASTQNQASNGLLFFYRYALKQELGNINALRAKRPPRPALLPRPQRTLHLLAHVKDIRTGRPHRIPALIRRFRT
jgi:hypothetical protein